MDRYIDRISMKEFKDKKYIDIPEEIVHKHFIEQSEETRAVFEEIHNLFEKAKHDKEMRSQLLGIYSNGVSASVDPRLYKATGFTELAYRTPKNSKIDAVVEMIGKVKAKDKNAGQIIFVDSTGKSAEHLSTDLHAEIKQKMIDENGYKPEEVAILNGSVVTVKGVEKKMSGERMALAKQEIVKQYNEGVVKVVIGTTKSAGEGMNIQKYTQDIYHLDFPWTPAEITQRNGRGVRFGNINKEVNVHYFFTKGSFDELMFNTVSKKKGWNELIWDSEIKQELKLGDVEGGGLPDVNDIALAMERDPDKRGILKLKMQYKKLENTLGDVQDEVSYNKTKMSGANAKFRELNERKAKIEQDIKYENVETKAMAELHQKALKEPKKYQARYEKAIKEAMEMKQQQVINTDKLIERARIAKREAHNTLKQSFQDEEVALSNIARFEDEHIVNGKFKSPVDVIGDC